MRKKLFLLFCVSCLFALNAVFGQTIIVHGKVQNEKGEAVAAASVKIKLTSKGTLTNDQGEFTLNVEKGKILIISAIGYEEQDVKAEESLTITLKDAEAATAGSDVVVTANAIRREKRTLGYSAPIIKSDELMQGQSTSPLAALAGRVPGVNVTSSTGAPGSSTRVVLRGGSSITGNNQALIVVDGVVMDNSSEIGGGALTAVDFGNRGNDINPDDIASVTVLKGPAAAALYGSRASNGALIYTTKSGSSHKKQEITFSSSNTFSSILKLPDFQNEYGQGYWSNKLDKDGNLIYTLDPRENGSWGPAFTGEVQEWGQEVDGKRLTKPFSALPDNIRNFFSTGFVTDNNVSIASGNEKASYYLGLNSVNSNGIYPGDYDTYNKYNVRFNGKAQLSNKFYSAISFNYSKIHQNQIGGGQGGGSVLSNLYQTPRDIPIDKMGDLNNKYYGYGYTDANGVPHNDEFGYYGVYTMSPYYLLKNYKNYDDVDRISGSFTIGYNPTDWLNIVERVGTDFYSDRRRLLEPKYEFYPIDPGTTGWYSAGDLQNSNGSYAENNITVGEVNHDLMITASHEFNKDFSGSLMVGNNIRQRSYTNDYTSTNQSSGLVVPGWYNFGNTNGPIYATNETSTKRLVGVYADLNLAYKNMLFLDATARNDWSSTLPKEHNSFFYPSVSGSFIFTELLKSSSITNVLNYGKLRASWAQVGNDADPYLLTTTYGATSISDGFASTQFPFNGIPGLQVGSTIGNPNLKPEITTSYEVGTELSFLHNRLSLDFSYYTNKSKNQILKIPIPNSTGYGFKVVNAGVIRNRGIELSLRGTPIKTNNFSLELYGTYYKNNSMVLSLMDGVSQVTIGGFNGMAIVAAVGHPYGEFYAVTNQTDGQGHTVVSAKNGIPLQTSEAQYLGSYNPDYQASFGGKAQYKNWTLGFLFDTKQGGVFYSQTKSYIDFNGTALETGGNRNPQIWPNSVINTGTAENPVYETNTSAKYIKQTYFGSYIPAGMNVIDGSFVKLRTLSLDYRVPTAALEHTPFGSLSVGLYGNNLFIWTPSSNQFVDPEMNSTGSGNEQGFDFAAQPSVRNYGVNIKVTF
ncbi:SusC/RagA family TonB-linked outer membrane protein [Arachidicoccus terrestris]|uniref:SusC/RagA family TonB-linked outer membrane protein n=1 Tax=Arachidicoccus terrestris TaxID=2875539 RepID=UPI001CC80F65|nr:SusC/RagA family TonB-linked outer membrane protein [Arachidicoccus terrestris]UAY57182.1 SusC/RagA family TonB-linked outer membrane protein [Arachidicoccus terrestris]